jgi:hypothetical protein
MLGWVCEERLCIGSWWGNRKERVHSGDAGLNVWIIVEWNFGKRGVYGLCWWKTGVKSPLVRHRRRWVRNISMDLWGEERV